ncbi:MAG: hypothetical protein ACXADA_13940 [Candidatus Hodarchaeales archaeon]
MVSLKYLLQLVIVSVMFLLILAPVTVQQVEGTAVESTIQQLSINNNWLLPHQPINIESNGDFVTLGVDGSGTSDDPYIIENLSIETSEGHGIYITRTTVHFIIRNCWIVASVGDFDQTGIYIDDIRDNTATIYNNTCRN